MADRWVALHEDGHTVAPVVVGADGAVSFTPHIAGDWTLRQAAKPRTLRDEVIQAVADVTVEWCGNGDTSDEGEAASITDAVLAVVKARVLDDIAMPTFVRRDITALFDGGAS